MGRKCQPLFITFRKAYTIFYIDVYFIVSVLDPDWLIQHCNCFEVYYVRDSRQLQCVRLHAQNKHISLKNQLINETRFHVFTCILINRVHSKSR